jgi:hypothetical protein
MIQGKCRKTRGCRATNGHTGICYDKKGHAIPKNRPVTVVKVVTRDQEGKTQLRRYYI